MSLNSIMSIAKSGLAASQSGISVVSKNAANINTDGYVRLEQQQTATSYGGANGGVNVTAIKRATNEYLESLYFTSKGNESAANLKSDYLDQLQSIFGDPSDDNSVFSTISNALASFESAATNPTSSLIKGQIITNLQNAISQISSAANQVEKTAGQVENDISSTVGDINEILQNIVTANAAVTRGTVAGDATGAQEVLSGYITQLSNLIDVKVDYSSEGVATVYTNNGTFLAGNSASKLSYSSLNGESDNSINIQFTDGANQLNIETSIKNGNLRGLLDLRDNDIAKMSESVNQLAGKFSDAVNSIYNLNASVPPMNSMTGSDTGLIGSDSLGFTGKTSIGFADSTGTLVKNLEVDFDNSTITVNGGGSVSFGSDINGFVSALNTALGGDGSASFSEGRLSISASNSNNGIVFDEPANGGSVRGDKAFAHFFGLNNLISSTKPTSYSTGIKASDSSGFVAGDSFRLNLSNADGKVLTEKTITIPSGSFNDILNVMNDPVSGFGLYGTFSLSDSGDMIFTQKNGGDDYNVTMIDDTENRADTTVTFGELFGLSDKARNSRASNISVNNVIASNPSNLALATVDLTADNVGKVVIGKSDSSGAQALYDASSKAMNFYDNPLSSTKVRMSLSDYMSSVAGDIATRSANAEIAAESAASFKNDAQSRLSNSVGVSLDEELVKLTQFQQAYSASARMLTAADDMYQTLLDSIR